MINLMIKKNPYIIIFLLFSSLVTLNVFAKTSGGIGIGAYSAVGAPLRGWFVYDNVKPGTILRDKVNIFNSTDEKLELVVYPVDAHNAEDGGYAPDNDDAPKTDVGSWITLAEENIALAPGTKKTIDFTIAVPARVGVGDHAGTILVRRKNPIPITQTDLLGSQIQTGVQLVARVGERVYISIVGEKIKKLQFEKIEFKKDASGKPFFYFTLSNQGNVRLNTNGTIEIYNAAGTKKLQSTDYVLKEVLPYSTIGAPVLWKEPLDGNFLAKAFVFNTNNERVERQTVFQWELLKIPTPVAINQTIAQISLYEGFAILILLGVILLLIVKRYIKKR